MVLLSLLVSLLLQTPTVQLAWDASPDAAQAGRCNLESRWYQVYRDGRLIAATQSPTFTDTAPLAGQHEYAVTYGCWNDQGGIVFESAPVALTAPPTPPEPTTGTFTLKLTLVCTSTAQADGTTVLECK